jgi:hypothetical protein
MRCYVKPSLSTPQHSRKASHIKQKATKKEFRHPSNPDGSCEFRERKMNTYLCLHVFVSSLLPFTHRPREFGMSSISRALSRTLPRAASTKA